MLLVLFKVYFAEILQLAVSGGNFSVFLCGLERFRLKKCINGSADYWGHSAVHITSPPFFYFQNHKNFFNKGVDKESCQWYTLPDKESCQIWVAQ